jgi:hypothetical protein
MVLKTHFACNAVTAVTQITPVLHRFPVCLPLTKSSTLCNIEHIAEGFGGFWERAIMHTAMEFLCAVYNQALHGVDWPEGDNDPDEKFDDSRYGLLCDVRELIARLEPEDATTLAVYRKVLCDFEDMPLEDDDEQERLVNCMEAIIAATEARFVARERQLERDRPAIIARVIAEAKRHEREHPSPRATSRMIMVEVPTTLRGVVYMLKRMVKRALPKRATAAA